jgi:Mitochondrial matrix Mmp37.
MKLLEDFTNSRDNKGNIVASFGYGSGVFNQAKYEKDEKSMIDMIFVVENTKLFTQENINNNPIDYSLTSKTIMKYIDLTAVKALNGVAYQSNVKFHDSSFKYGIIGINKFLSDMQTLDSFFIPGRFQKEIYTVRSTDEIDQAIKNNRELALFIALLSLPREKDNLLDLYQQICRLSYDGDIRMLFAENPKKIENIVTGSFKFFLDTYGFDNKYFYSKSNGKIVIDEDSLYDGIFSLPENLLQYIINKGYLRAKSNNIGKLIKKRIEHINFKESIAQPVTGLITVGPVKSTTYLVKKIGKRFSK